MRLADLKTQALRYVVLGDLARAARLYEAIVTAHPADLDARMKIADLCVAAGQPDLARRVYAAVAFYDVQAGRPLHAVVVAQALASLGADVAGIYDSLAALYASGSPRVASGGGGARLSPPDPEADVPPPDLGREVPLPTALTAAADAASSTTDLTETIAALVAQTGGRFPPVPLLSDLSPAAFARVLAAAVVHRLPSGARIIEQGQPGSSFFMLAAGRVRVEQTPKEGGEPIVLAQLGEGAVFGEAALVSAQPRAATVVVVGEADLVEIGGPALAAAADELAQVAEALSRFTRDRLLKNLIATSPLFKPFSVEERLELAKRFTGHEIAAGGTVVKEGDEATGLWVVLSGELDVVTGEEPFDTTVATLHGGDTFGEVELLRGGPSTATVLARRGPATLLFLPRDAFMRLVTVVPELKAHFEALAEKRITETRAAVERGAPEEDQAIELDDDDALVLI
jgi:cAMP-dependent protein kinase regulator